MRLTIDAQTENSAMEGFCLCILNVMVKQFSSHPLMFRIVDSPVIYRPLLSHIPIIKTNMKSFTYRTNQFTFVVVCDVQLDM